jgi:hypothetical protein
VEAQWYHGTVIVQLLISKVTIGGDPSRVPQPGSRALAYHAGLLFDLQFTVFPTDVKLHIYPIHYK